MEQIQKRMKELEKEADELITEQKSYQEQINTIQTKFAESRQKHFQLQGAYKELQKMLNGQTDIQKTVKNVNKSKKDKV